MTGTWATGWATGDMEIAAEFKKGVGNIFDSTLGASAANVDITSITGAYAHLFLVVYARSDTVATSEVVNMRFNNDSAANYDSQRLLGQAAATQAQEGFAATQMVTGFMPAGSAPANLFNALVAFIPNYAGSANNKLFISISSTKIGTSTTNLTEYLQAGFWRSNAAITRITVLPPANNFVTGTRVSLYGMGA